MRRRSCGSIGGPLGLLLDTQFVWLGVRSRLQQAAEVRANSPIEPANRFWFSDFPKIRNVVAQIFPRWNRLAEWLTHIDVLQRAA
jgi:hypothetical protein